MRWPIWLTSSVGLFRQVFISSPLRWDQREQRDDARAVVVRNVLSFREKAAVVNVVSVALTVG